MNNQKQIVVTKKTIRSIHGGLHFKGTLEYTTSKGQGRSVILTREDRGEVEREINFRINGLKNGGVQVVGGPRVKL